MDSSGVIVKITMIVFMKRLVKLIKHLELALVAEVRENAPAVNSNPA
jgi:hypothetical protein